VIGYLRESQTLLTCDPAADKPHIGIGDAAKTITLKTS
jgi:hypothetical protein